MWPSLSLAVCLFVFPAALAAEPLGIGRRATSGEIAAWDIDVRPDGTGLPPGHGSVAEGEPIFAKRCAACHGAHGDSGDDNPVSRIAGGEGSLQTVKPVRTVGSYWPYATTLFDYIRRAMPLTAPQSLSPDEIYAVSAYLLFLNGIIPRDAVLNPTTLPRVQMPNRSGFVQAEQARGNGEVPK